MSKGYYDYKGFELPRVTSICGQLDKSIPLMQWSVNCMKEYFLERYVDFLKQDGDMADLIEEARMNYKDISKEAMDIGSEVHADIEKYLLTGKEPKNPRPEVLAAFIAFLEWKDSHEIEVLKVEHSVYSLDPPFAGTLDLICMLDGVKTYIDFKSSKAIYEPYRYQIAAYRSTDENPDECGSGILRLDKETGFPEYKDLTDKYESDIDIFNDLCMLWWKRKPRKRKQFEDKGGIL